MNHSFEPFLFSEPNSCDSQILIIHSGFGLISSLIKLILSQIGLIHS